MYTLPYLSWRTNKVLLCSAAAAAAAAKSLQSCPTLCDPHRRQPTRLPRPWDSPGKNTGVGCHFLLQCRKVKSEREVAQSCPTLSDPMDCSLPGSSAHGIFQARIPEWGAIAFSAVWHRGTLISYVAAWMGEEFGREWIHTYVWLSCFALHLILSEHC